MIKTIYFQDIFLFTYDVRGSADVNSNYPDLGYDIDNCKLGATMTVEFQILLQNFKASKKVDVIKAYSFRLLGVYFVDNLVHSTMSTLKKR